MGQFLEQFVPAGVDPGLFVLGVIMVVLLVSGVVLIVTGKWEAEDRRRTFNAPDPYQVKPPLVPGRTRRHWDAYIAQDRAGWGLRSPLVQPPDEWSLDAFLRDTPPAVKSGPAPTEAAPVVTSPAPFASSPAAVPSPPSPAESPAPEWEPLPPPEAQANASPARPGVFRPPTFPPSLPSLPHWHAPAPAEPPAQAPADAEEQDTGSWEQGRPWEILPSQFPVDPPPSDQQPAASAMPEQETTLQETTCASGLEQEPAQRAALAPLADASRGAVPSHEAAPLVPPTVPPRVGMDTPPSSAEAPAASCPPESGAPSALPPSALEEAGPPDPRRCVRAPEARAVSHAPGEEPEPLLLEESGSLPSAATALLEIRAFGEAHLVVLGQVVPMRKATKKLELALYLAHQAAPFHAQGKEAPYTARETLAEALWPSHPDAGLQRQSLNNIQLKLSKHLQEQATTLTAADWLESGHGHGALRLRPQVPTDLTSFVRLAQRLAQSVPQDATRLPRGEDVAAWVDTLHQLYQGGFALQFREEDWMQSARARYQRQYLDACLDGARLLARLGQVGQAILLAEELLLAEEAQASTILPFLLGWLLQDGGKAAVASWQEAYQRRYFYKFQRHLFEDHPDLDALFRHALA